MNCSTVQTVTTTLNGTAVSQSVYAYDQYNNVAEEKDYDWGPNSPGGLVRDTQTTYATTTTAYNYTVSIP